MKRIVIFSTTLLMGLVFTSFSNRMEAQTSTKKPATEQQVAKKYTCKMHPEVVMDKPGKCPKCGMALVEKTDIKKDEMHHMCDSAMMNHDHNMMKDSMHMKKGMMHDSTKMNQGMKMKQ